MEAIFLRILNISITASWIALAVMVGRILLKKAPKWISVLMWGLVSVRLLFPFSFESVFSLIPSAETIPSDILYSDTPAIHSGVDVLNSIVNPIMGESLAPSVGASVNPMQVLAFVATIVWLAGIAAMLAYMVISYIRVHNKVREAVVFVDNIWICDHVDTPFILGVICPRIYLPSALNERDMEYVIAHEKAHLRRHDHLWKPLGYLLLTVYWFNPIIWVAYILLCRDIELACDEKVIRDMGTENKKPYSDALINCSAPRRTIAACPLAFGEIGVKGRVKSVLNYKKPAFWVIIVAVIACVVVALCFLTNPKTDDTTIKIIVPAGSQSRLVYADKELSPTKNQVIISCGENLGDTEVILRPVEATEETAGKPVYMTPGMSVKLNAEKGVWYRIGVNVQNPTDEAIAVYVNVENVEVRFSPKVVEWFDYLEAPDKMPWDSLSEINIPEFPNVTFRWSAGKIEAVTEKENKQLYTGMPIWSAYFCDLTGDGMPELCSTVSFGSGMIDDHVMVYDYANSVSYTLEDRGTYDYTLRLNGGNGGLYVDQKKYGSDEFVSTGLLALEGGSLRIVRVETNFTEQATNEQELRDKYPEYFGLDAKNGLDVYVWQLAEGSYSFGLLHHTEAQRPWVSYELLNLVGTDADEMRLILSTYDIDESDIAIIPWQNPISSYIADVWMIEDGESQEEKLKAYINNIRNMLFGDGTISSTYDYPIYDSIVFDIDVDGKDEYCVLGYGRTSGLFTFTFSASEAGAEQPEYETVFCTEWYDLSFVGCDDGVVRVQGIDQADVPQTHLFDITIIDGIVRLSENGKYLSAVEILTTD